MPKQILKIDQFHGGLSNNSDSRDIADNELSEATDIMVDEVGRIRMLGGIETAHYNFSVSVKAGYGLFQFSSDYKGGDGTIADGEAETNYLAMWDNVNSEVGILEGTTARAGIIDLGSGGGEPAFYNVDGALRVSDGAQGSTNTNQWYGFCNRKYFGADEDEDFVSWKATDQLPAAPTDGNLKKHAGANNWDKSTNEKPAAANGFLRMSISANPDSSTVTWIPCEAYNESQLDVYWYALYGALDAGGDSDYSELLDGGTGATDSTDYFNSDWTDANRDSGVNLTDIVVHLDATEANCTVGGSTSAPSGFDSDITACMSLKKVKSEGYSRFMVKTDTSIDLRDKSIFFDLYISLHMAGILDSVYIIIGGDVGQEGGGSDFFSWEIDASKFTGTVSDWQRVEVFTGNEPKTTVGSPYLGSIDEFVIAFVTKSSSDKFGYVSGGDEDSSVGDCLIYNIRYGDPIEGAGWNGYYNFYYSWLYDDEKQESALFEFKDHTTGAVADYNFTGTGLHFRAWAQQAADPTYGFNHGTTSANPRITGANMYYTEVDSSGDSIDPEKYYLCTVDFENGIRKSPVDDFSAWAGGADGSIGDWYAPSGSPLRLNTPPQVTTFAINAGYDDSNSLTNLYYKTAVVANRMAYVGNVKYTDANSKNHVLGDAMLKSHVGKFDLFTSDRLIEASVRDGDSIVKLEEYADRILQFKKTKMHLINVSQELEFLEDTFMHKGVSHPAATCKTDFGIAWVNTLGCYLYDGQKVTNLLEKKGRQIIKESEWEIFSANEPMIGYVPKKRQLIVVDSTTNAGGGKVFLYDMVTQSWIKSTGVTFADANKTNLVTDWNGDLIHGIEGGNIYKWDDTSAQSSGVDIKTKDIDFGNPGQRKKIYKIYVTHRGSASNIQTSYAIDGDQDAFTNAGSTLPATDPVTDWATTEVELKVSNCFTLRLRFSSDGLTPANFEINDVSIVYRLKPVK